MQAAQLLQGVLLLPGLTFRVEEAPGSSSHQSQAWSEGLSSHLAPEERLGPGPAVLVVNKLEEEEVEEGDEGGHAEPEEEREARVALGHVLFVRQDGLEVECVPQVLQVHQVGGDVQQGRDGLRHHDGEGVPMHLGGQLHGVVGAAALAGVQLHRLLLELDGDVQEGLAVRVQQHRQADQVLVVMDPPQGVAVLEDLRVGLELQVVFGELQPAKAQHHPLHEAVGPGGHQPLAAALLQRQLPEVGELQDLQDGGQLPGPQVLGVHGGVAAEAVVGVVQRGLHFLFLLGAVVGVQEGSRGGGEDKVECQVDGVAGWGVSVEI
ncbi:hypothetical protein E2320_006141 [Naja naja]|nr:hypothetical protein E2320_006141 [Naja naja]